MERSRPSLPSIIAVRRLAARLLLRLAGLRSPAAMPVSGHDLIVAGPHTSWLDMPLLLLVCWAAGVEVRFLINAKFISGHLSFASGLLLALGAVPIDLSQPRAGLQEAAGLLSSGRGPLVISPKGHVQRGPWKPGFIRIARASGAGVAFLVLDWPRRRLDFFAPAPLSSQEALLERARVAFAGADGLVRGREDEVRLETPSERRRR